MEIDTWVDGYKVRAFPWVDGKRSDWVDVKEKIMYALLVEKFTNLNLQNALLSTGEKILQEGNYWGDTFTRNTKPPSANCKRRTRRKTNTRRPFVRLQGG